ncbi:MAG: L,D-transpeptidase family protein [Pseudomonadota bacterium]
MPHQALVSGGGRVLVAAIGEAGIVTEKREGDRATPRLRLRPVAGLSRGRLRPGVPYRRVRDDDGWCDDPRAQRYNRPVRLPHPRSHEVLKRADALYDVVLFTDHNRCPRVLGRGSAIFVHVARPGLSGTMGCIAFPERVWRHGVVPLGDYLIGIDPRPKRTH